MKMPKDMANSKATFTVSLPRVVIRRGGKAHVLSVGSNIYNLATRGTESIEETVCHSGDEALMWTSKVRWATPDDPTCKLCLRTLENL